MLDWLSDGARAARMTALLTIRYCSAPRIRFEEECAERERERERPV